MNRNIVKNRNLISRFSSSLLGRGKKVEGHKTFFNLLLSLKLDTERELLNLNLQQIRQKDIISNTSFVFFLCSIGFHEKILQKFFPKNEKAFQVMAKAYSKSILSPEKGDDNNPSGFIMPSHNIKSSQLRQLQQEPVITFDETPQLQLGNLHEVKEAKYVIKSQNIQEENQAYPFSVQALSSKSLCKITIDNVKPVLETRKIRKGRITYRIPLVTRTERQEGKAISWLIFGANSRKNKMKNSQSAFSLVSTKSPTKGIISGKADRNLLSFYKPEIWLKENVLYSSEKTIPSNLKRVEGLSALIENKKKHYRSLQYCLAESFLDAFQGKGESVEKRKEFHQLALQNRAYTHYRWW